MATNNTGAWSSLLSWPLVGIHSVMTANGKVLTFGTDVTGAQGAVMYHDVWDPVTGEHQLLNHTMTTPTDIFCANAMTIPGTNDILIAGGDARPLGTVNVGVSDVNIYNATTNEIASDPLGHMQYARWYATAISMPNGQVLAIGGFDQSGKGVATPEIYTPGVGWKTLTGATDTQEYPFYTRAFVRNDGKVVYFGTGGGQSVMLLDTAGDGAITKIGTVPSGVNYWLPSTQYAPGKILMSDSSNQLWTMDINAAAPVATKVGALADLRIYSNMTVLANGDVLITGGATVNNYDSTAVKTAVLWNPTTNALTTLPPEDIPRLYHSTGLLLQDGSVLSTGGGSLNSPSNTIANQLNAQIYKPAYLFDANGNEAVRPQITTAPDHLKAGSSFTITVDNAADISKLTFVRTGATTHDFNMSSGAVSLQFTQVGDGHTLTVTMPDVQSGIAPGGWMLFAWNKAGVPSVAPIIQIDPIATNLVLNGDFQNSTMTAPTSWEDFQFQTFDNLGVAGWKNLSDNAVELTKYNGSFGLDLDVGLKSDAIYQDIKTVAGKAYTLHFDVARVQTTANTSSFEVVWNDKVVATINPTGPKGYDFTVTGTGGSDRLMFRELSSQNNGGGAFLDNVSLKGPPPTPTYDNLIVNGDFQSTVMTTPTKFGDISFQGYANDGIAGWKNQSDNYMEIIKIDAGTQGIDLDAGNKVDAIYQDVKTEAGMSYKLDFDVIRATAGTSAFDVLWNDTVVARIDPKAPDAYEFNVIGTGGTDRLTFRELASQNDAYGAFVDNVALTPGSMESMASMHHGTTSMLVNGDLESRKMTATTYWQAYDNTGVPGWRNAAESYVEVVKTATSQALEVDARGAVDTLFQGVKTESGKTYNLHFDVVNFAANTSKFDVLWNDKVVATVDPTGKQGYDMTVTGTGNVDTLAFREYASQNDWNGAWLDNISLNEAHGHGSTISIAARGWMGNETMVLLIDGKEAARFDNVSSTASVYTFEAETSISPKQVRIAFVNDQWDPAAGVDANLTVDKITIDGKDYQTEGLSTLSTATWSDADGFSPGYGRGDTLHTNGFFQFAPVSAGSTIAIDARGWTGQESIALFIDDVQVATFDSLATAGGVYTYHAGATVTANQVRVAFLNDSYDAATGTDANVTIDKITIDGKVFQTEASSVYSTGAWTANDGIVPGYARGETLHTNGYVQYADATDPGVSGHASLISNGSFEVTNVALPSGAAFKVLDASGAGGWTSAGGYVEVWRDGFNGQPGTSGRNVVEIDAGNGALSQNVTTTAGNDYGLSFDLAGRSGVVGSSKVEVVWNGQVVTTVTPQDDAFHTYHVNLTGTGHDTLTFRSTSGDTDGVGGLLDNVVLHDHALLA